MPNLSRWMKYARARLDAAIGQGHRDLDELEARREAELADKPWLGAEGDAPTFDEARARIEWQAARAAEQAEAAKEKSGTDADPAPSVSPQATAAGEGGPPATTPDVRAEAAEAANARVELEARERASAARLEAIRDELGIEPPAEE